MQTFKLIPYPAESLPKIDITGEIIRSGDKLLLRYRITGNVEQILLPAKAISPSRREDLWKATCFELFVAIPNRPEYWEFNMSPSRDWNVYKMDAYRRVGFREEIAFEQLPFVYRYIPGKLSLDITVDLSPILVPKQKVQIGITTILQTIDGKETLWALSHPGAQADFHLKESFSIRI